ncbi:MAG TPA: PDDEXK nuclease domain-containing protein, partial [Bacteroidia bacterium]|nr:PDDEXK nuclease domain-containing protein [Bacteroidia bacterium]
NESGWGSKIIDRLAADLKFEFPSMKGLSPRNLRYMRNFALAYPQFVILQKPAAKTQDADNQTVAILQQAAAKLPWGHHQLLLDKVKNIEERSFYILKCAENGWSRNVMLHQIESGLYNRQGALTNNFNETLPASQSELTQQLFKDPYNLDFIMLSEEAKEKDLEDALITHVTKLLLELGDGFAFMGRQKRLEAGGKEFFVDLLLYHTKLRRYVIIELKIGEFEPEFVSKMNVYLGLADDQLKGEFDQPSIGLILCKTKNKIVAEYALRDTSKPIGIAEYKIRQMLPEDIKGELPSIEEIESKLDEEIREMKNPIDKRLQFIKEKIKNIKTDEIQTPATFNILSEIYQTGLRLLFLELMEKVKVFEEDFYSKSFHWHCDNNNFKNLTEVDDFWKVEENLKQIANFSFQIRLNGFKKAGTEHCNSSHTLSFKMDTYHFSFTLLNYNNQQPFLKKMYHQPLTENDRQLISDRIMTAIMDDIEQFLVKINEGE